jgi:RNA polymerase sigma-70 factor (ECF subfamily)
VLAAGGAAGSADAHQALTTLCEIYWYPLYGFLRGRGHSAEDAEDLTQAFFARVVERRAIQHADRDRGRFRSFLLASLTHFTANEHHRDIAKKRGGGVAILSLEFQGAEGRFQLEPSTDETPERVFDRRWALTLLDRVMGRLKAEMVRAGKRVQFERLQACLTGDRLEQGYAQIAADLGTSEGAVKVTVHRLRRRYRDLVRDEIAQTVASPQEIEDELRHLWSAVSR